MAAAVASTAPWRRLGALCGLICFLTWAFAAEGRDFGPLIEPEPLAAMACAEDVRVLDIRAEEEVRAGHVPCAVHAPYPGQWLAERHEVPRQLPAPEALSELLGGLGITPEHRVVVVGSGRDPGAVAGATRVYWSLAAAGHAALALLDGGMRGWGEARLPVATGIPAVPGPEIYPVPEALSHQAIGVRADMPGLVDNNSAEIFLGLERVEGLQQRAGTMPGAVNLPYAWLVRPDGRLRSGADLHALYSVAGVEGAAPVHFCVSGQVATLGWFVSHEILGLDEASVYDGSLTAWTADPVNPVVNRMQAAGAGEPVQK